MIAFQILFASFFIFQSSLSPLHLAAKLASPAAVVMEKLANTSEEVGTSLQTR